MSRDDREWADDVGIEIYEKLLSVIGVDARLKEIKQGLLEAIERGRLAGLEEAAAIIGSDGKFQENEGNTEVVAYCERRARYLRKRARTTEGQDATEEKK